MSAVTQLEKHMPPVSNSVLKLKTELRNSASYYLGHSQKIIGKCKQSHKCIQDLGINYTNLLIFFSFQLKT